jgi:hypothetical protein
MKMNEILVHTQISMLIGNLDEYPLIKLPNIKEKPIKIPMYTIGRITKL